jgi:hypothetical protein
MHRYQTQFNEKRPSCCAARFTGVVLAALAMISVAGCMVGPNYHRPDVQTPATYRTLAPDS